MNLKTNRVQRILDALDNSLTQMMLVFFFYRNPGAMDTVDGLARWVGINATEIKVALFELQQIGMVQKMGKGVTAVYFYQPDAIVKEVLDAVMRQIAQEQEERFEPWSGGDLFCNSFPPELKV